MGAHEKSRRVLNPRHGRNRIISEPNTLNFSWGTTWACVSVLVVVRGIEILKRIVSGKLSDQVNPNLMCRYRFVEFPQKNGGGALVRHNTRTACAWHGENRQKADDVDWEIFHCIFTHTPSKQQAPK